MGLVACRNLSLPKSTAFLKPTQLLGNMAQHISSSHLNARSIRPIHLVVDFDGTLTRKDTMHLVAEAGYSRQEELGNRTQPRPWEEIVDAYISDFEKHSSSFVPKAAERTTLEEEKLWLNSLKPIEKASVARALGAGIFDGIRETNMIKSVRIAHQAGKFQIRDGWFDLLSYVWNHNTQVTSSGYACGSVNILSVNWSRCFVTRALQESVPQSTSSLSAENFLIDKNLAVFANELPSIIEDRSSPEQLTHKGGLSQGQSLDIRTSGDKLDVMQNLILASPVRQNPDSASENALSIYVGDSSTDLECLIAADVGICIRDEPMGSGQEELAETCERIGIEVQDLNNLTSPFDLNACSSKCLFWVTGFTAITEWLSK